VNGERERESKSTEDIISNPTPMKIWPHETIEYSYALDMDPMPLRGADTSDIYSSIV